MALPIVSFESITPNELQIEKLYELLALRKHNISHKDMPSYEDHENFVLEHTYRAWFLVYVDQQCIGSLYLNTDNTIGLNVCDGRVKECIDDCISFIKNNYEPYSSIPSKRSGVFAINISPENDELLGEIEKRGYEPVQVTYII